MVAEGDKVWVHYTTRGTHKGELKRFGFSGSIAPTGKQVTFRGFRAYRIAGGKIVEHWGIAQNLQVMQQLDAIRPTGEGGE